MGSTSASVANIDRIESGIDWVTWVRPMVDGESALQAFGRRVVRLQEEKGSRVTPLRIEGYTGLQAESCAFGCRSDSEYLRISGKLASSLWSEIPTAGGRPSRVDVMTSFWLKTSDSKFGSRHFRDRGARVHQRRGRPLKRVLSKGNDGLFIGSVGSRTSRHYLRFYDKGVESGCAPPGVFWRIELEAKKDLAPKLFSEAKAAPDHHRWCVDTCERAVKHVNSTWPLPAQHGLPPMPSADEKELPSITRTKEWLRTSVAPSIERILPTVGIHEVLEILGLDGYAYPDIPRSKRT